MQIINAVVVITGASSGIGRATARLFARHGATLVLAARRSDALQEVAAECSSLGGYALAQVTDVSQSDQVQALAQLAVARFGRIDIWINNAGVMALGRVDEIPLPDHEQLLATNLLGYLYGTRAAVRQFRSQGFGLLINNASMLAAVAIPFASSYCASKWAVRGLTESVRMELLDQPGIKVCAVLPASIATPIFQSGANYSGRATRAPEPVYSPERVAAAMLAVARRPRREVFVGGFGRLAALSHGLAPALTERVATAFTRWRLFQPPAAAATAGSIREPSAPVSPGNAGHGPLIWDRLERPLALAALGVPLALAWWSWRQRRRSVRHVS